MGRIRYVKPEFFEDEKMTDCSIEARFLYVGLWCHMDLNGVTECSPKLMKSRIFPHDTGVTLEKISALLSELTAKRRLIFFEFKGEKLLFCPALKKHQHFHHKEKKKWEIPTKILQELVDATDGQLDLFPNQFQDTEEKPQADPGPAPDLPRIDPHLKERKGKEKEVNAAAEDLASPAEETKKQPSPIRPVPNPRIPHNPPPETRPHPERSPETESMVKSFLSKLRGHAPSPEGA